MMLVALPNWVENEDCSATTFNSVVPQAGKAD
jgi:hypothetical protein